MATYKFDIKAELENEFARRRRSNSSYSLRAFAKHLEVDASTISQIMSGKRKVSETFKAKMLEKLGAKNSGPLRSYLIQQDAFAAIADWYHFAILDLALLDGFKSDIGWIAKKLDISKTESSVAIKRLLRLGLLVNKDGRLSKARAQYTNYFEGQTSTAHKEYQRQILQKALAAIDGVSQERKDITAITIAGNSNKIEQAKEKIKKFRRDLCDFMEDGDGDTVFVMSVQLFPISERIQE